MVCKPSRNRTRTLGEDGFFFFFCEGNIGFLFRYKGFSAVFKAEIDDSAPVRKVVVVEIVPPTITTDSLLNGTVNTPYNARLEVDGIGTISWDVVQGSLPNGLTLNRDTGVISGSPSSAGQFNFTIRVANVVGYSDQSYIVAIGKLAGGSVVGTLVLESFGYRSFTVNQL